MPEKTEQNISTPDATKKFVLIAWSVHCCDALESHQFVSL